MDRVEANLDLEERNARVDSYNLHGSQGDHRKIQHNQGDTGSTTQKEEGGLETQKDYQPVFVDGIPGFPWPQERTLQQTMRLGSNKDPSYLEENSRIRYNPSLLEENRGIYYNLPPAVDPCSNQLEQSTNHKDQLKQGSQGEAVLDNVSRFFQDFQAESSLLAQRQVELEVDGVGAEVKRDTRDFLEREPVIREVSREPLVREVSRERSRVESIPRRVPREELLLSASKLNCHHASQNCSK